MKTDFKKQGKKNKASGARFELKVRKDLESKGWIVAKWSNNVEFAQRIGTINNMKDANEYPSMKQMSGKLIPAKRKFNPFNKVMMMSSGFPDFIAFRRTTCLTCVSHGFGECGYGVIGVESKSNGYLSKEERAKCKWLIENLIFSRILIVRKSKKKGEIEYEEFKS